ncbi:long-chain-fatty-acid--CoA ligase heimdall [Drosophila subobscura]|uniref:long-chain-fatty-acid--CoA ligase heimdall n=1 Tax=Drosophila subobscura TaxID=7241 RepID=UPI00155B3EE8|nr:long-chain-fatty-acid--CoA ligase heimdall [Drosophila subobscura]
MNDIDLERSNLKPATSYISTSLHEAVKLRLDVAATGAMAEVPPQTIPRRFQDVCQQYADHPALVWETPGKGTNGWTTLTYADYQRRVEQTALMLLEVGLEERSSLGVLAFNCPEWFFAELGAMRAGAVVAGIYPSNSAEAVRHVLATSEATVCVVDDAQQMAKLRAIKDKLPRLKAVIQLHGPYEAFVDKEESYYSWQLLEEKTYSAALKQELLDRESRVYANECAMLIFTSGTVGLPKAVMLTHDSIVFNAKSASACMKDVQEGAESMVSFLPLSHIAAQIFDVFLGLEHGGCVTFADKDALKGTLVRTFQKAKPTRIFGVPRVFEKFQERLVAAEAKAKPYSRLLLSKARAAVAEYQLAVIAGEKPSLYATTKYWLASRMIRPIRQMMGLDNCRSFLTGGAPTSDEMKNFFLGLDIALGECYGMSETGGAITLNSEISNLFSSGQPIAGVEVKVQEPDASGKGEIVLRGRSNFMGYLGQQEKTEETINADGWLLSGDLGYFDTHGNVVISGRLKELIITAGGENIPPVHIEELIKKELPCVANALLVGDHRKYLTVLLSLKTKSDPATGIPLDGLREETIEWLHELDINQTRLSELLNIPADLQLPNETAAMSAALQISAEPKLLEAIEAGIKRANKNAISNAQRVQKFALIPHEFSLATGELGPTLKIRRNIVHAKYAPIIERLYN